MERRRPICTYALVWSASSLGGCVDPFGRVPEGPRPHHWTRHGHFSGGRPSLREIRPQFGGEKAV